MSKKEEELQEISRLRKAVMPLFEQMNKLLEQQVDSKLELFERKLNKIADTRPTVNLPEPNVTVSAPDVVVPEPKVTVKVDAPDLSEITKLLRKQAPQPIIVKQDDWQPHDQGKKGIYRYNGFVKSDGSWRIQRIAKNEQRYATGRGNYEEAWNSKDTQSYGVLGNNE